MGISRVLAAKLALCCRVDALGDQTEASVGKEFKEYVENRLAVLEEGGMRSGAKGISRPSSGKFEKNKDATKSGSAQYNKDADAVDEPAPKKKRKMTEDDGAEEKPK